MRNMYMVKQAFLSFWRDKRKNLLIGFILTFHFFLLINISMVHISIKSMIANYEKKLSYTVRLVPSYILNKRTEQLTEEQYLKYGKSDFLENMTLTGTIPVTLENLETANTQPVTTINKGEERESEYSTINQTVYTAILSASMSVEDAEQFPINSGDLLRGSSKLALNECLISKNLAKLNGLAIGSKIFVQLFNEVELIRKELTVAGIIKDTLPATTSDRKLYQQEEIITNYATLKKMQTSINTYSIDAVYQLKKAEELDQFKKEVTKEGLPENYQMLSDKETASQRLAPFKSKKEITVTLIMSVFILGTVLLLLFSMVIAKKRSNEIYTLMSFGMSKRRIFCSQFIDKLCLTAFCLFISLILSQVTMEIVNNRLMVWIKQLLANDFYFFSDYNLPMTTVPITIDSETLKIIAISVGGFLISTGISDSFQLWMFNPTKFLLEGKTKE